LHFFELYVIFFAEYQQSTITRGTVMNNSWIEDQYGSEVAQLAADYQAKKFSRRSFLGRLTAVGFSVGAAASILAACGSSSSDTAVVDTTAAPDLTPKVGGTLREGYPRDVSKHDPITSNWYDPAFSAIYETIVTDGLEGDTVPQFASAYEVSEDGLTYTFEIPEGRVSHSGGAMGAQQVSELLQTIKDTSFIGGVSTVPMEGYSFEGNKVFMKMKNAWLGALNPHKTGYWAMANIDTWKAAGGADATSTYGTESADGTGPFTHAEWVPGSHTLVNRWDAYPGSNTPYVTNPGAAYLDAIRWSVITEAGQRATMLENGELDTLIGPNFSDIERLKSNADMTVIQHPEWSGYHLTMNRDYPEFFGDKLTRQGLSHALNRQGMVDAILFGNGDATYGPFPKTDRQYEPKVENFNQYDVEVSKAKLAEAGWVAGADGVLERDGFRFEFEYVVEDETIQKLVAEAVAQQFKEVGVIAKLKVVDRAVAFQEQSGEGRKAAPMALFFWLWPVPLDILVIFGSSETIPVPNFSHAVEPTIDAAIAEWRLAGTPEAGVIASSKFQTEWADTLPYLPLMNQYATFVHQNYVKNWAPFVWNLYPLYNDVWLDK
jgi:peptide/nickel transport system substrate-binding protein